MNVLVPVSPSRTNQPTIEDAVGRLHDRAEEVGTIHLVYTETPGKATGRPKRATALLERSRATATAAAGYDVEVVTAYLARDEYLANPHDHAAVLAAYVTENDVDLIVMDPNYTVDATDRTLHPVEHAYERAGLAYEKVSVEPTGRPPLVEVTRFAAIFVLTISFYLVVSATFEAFGLATGIIGATIAGVLFRNVALETTPGVATVAGAIVRGALFVPYLLAKIIVANVQISYIILHPALPIDPHLDRIQTGLGGGLTVTSLANSLTLTPGTVTVDAERDNVLVHSITEDTRLEVLTGERTNGIRFVFYGLTAIEDTDTVDIDRVETVTGPKDVLDLSGGRHRD